MYTYTDQECIYGNNALFRLCSHLSVAALYVHGVSASESLLSEIKMDDAHAYVWMETLHIFKSVLLWYIYAYVHIHIQMKT